MLGTGRVRRFTQDTPVLPDVWLEYAKGPDDPTRRTGAGAGEDPFPPSSCCSRPYRENSAGDVRKALRGAAGRGAQGHEWRRFGHDPKEPPRLVYNQSTVAATLYFEDLVRAVLPMTDWWARLVDKRRIEALQTRGGAGGPGRGGPGPGAPAAAATSGERTAAAARPALDDARGRARWRSSIAASRCRERSLDRGGSPRRRPKTGSELVEAVADLIHGVEPGRQNARIYSVSLNREAAPTVAARAWRSRPTPRGASSTSPATTSPGRSSTAASTPRIRPSASARETRTTGDKKPFAVTTRSAANCTRVVETYDFTQIELLLDPDTPSSRGTGQAAEERSDGGGAGARRAARRSERRARRRPHARLEADRAAAPHPARDGQVRPAGHRSRHARRRHPRRQLAQSAESGRRRWRTTSSASAPTSGSTTCACSTTRGAATSSR